MTMSAIETNVTSNPFTRLRERLLAFADDPSFIDDLWASHDKGHMRDKLMDRTLACFVEALADFEAEWPTPDAFEATIRGAWAVDDAQA